MTSQGFCIAPRLTALLLLIAASCQQLPASGFALNAETDALRTAGWDAAYETDYVTARAKFAELRRLLPAHPIGDLSLASIVWQEYLFRTRRFQTTLYQKNSSFYDGAQHTPEEKEGDPVDPQVDAEFQQYLQQALSKAQAMVDAAPKDVEALYFLGAVYGVRAAYAGSAQRKFWAALRDGLRSVKLHRQVIELEPDFYDAYLTIGMYHYVAGAVPQPFRFIAMLAGIRGNKQKGIQELESVVCHGTFNREDARALLVALYRYEDNPRQSLLQLRAFSARYPRNILLKIETGTTLAQLHQPAEAAATFEALLRISDQRLTDLVLFQYGESLALNRDYRQAAARFAAVSETPGAEKSLIVHSLLRAGQMCDLAGDRPRAVTFYNEYRARATHPAARKYVEKWLRKPFAVT